MNAPPYTTARIDVSRLPGGARRRRRRRRRGAARDPHRGQTGRGHDADAGARRGARARVLHLRGAQPAGARLPDDLAANVVEVDAPGSIRTGWRARSTPRPRVACVARARSRRSPSRRLGSRASSPWRSRSCRSCLSGFVRRRRRSSSPVGCTRPGSSRRRRAALPPRGRRPAQRDGQGDRLGVARGAPAARGVDPLRQRAALVRARAEGSRCRLPRSGRGRRAVDARGRAGEGPRRDALRLRPRRPGERLLEPWRITPDGRPARRRRLDTVRLAQGTRSAGRRDARRARLARTR